MRKSLITAALVAATLVAPAAAQADFMSDGHVTRPEAVKEVRALLGDADIRASMFRVPTTLFDGTPSSVEDPAVARTSYKLDSCTSVNAKQFVCVAGVSAYKAHASEPFRAAMITLTVTAVNRRTGITTVTQSKEVL